MPFASHGRFHELLAHPTINFFVALAIALAFTALALAGVINMALAYGLLVVAWAISMAVCYVATNSKRNAAISAISLSVIFFFLGLLVFSRPKQDLSGPRFEFAGIKVERKDGYSTPVLQVHNTSEVAAGPYQIIGGMVLSDHENNLANMDISDLIRAIEDAGRKVVLTPVDQIQITRGMGVSLRLNQQFPDSDIALVNNGSKKMYVVMLAIYATNKTPENRMWVTELCARVTKPFTNFQSCPSHNRYFFSDRSLNEIE